MAVVRHSKDIGGEKISRDVRVEHIASEMDIRHARFDRSLLVTLNILGAAPGKYEQRVRHLFRTREEFLNSSPRIEMSTIRHDAGLDRQFDELARFAFAERR